MAEVFIIGEKFIRNDRVVLILGDNIFYGSNFSNILKEAIQKEDDATVFGYYVTNPEE